MIVRRAATTVVVALVLAAAGCGGDGKPAQQEVVEQGMYCGVVQRFRDAASSAGVVVPAPEGAPVSAATVKLFVDTMGPGLDQLSKDAPGEVREDAGTVVDGLRGAAGGDLPALGEAAFQEAWSNVAAYGDRVCAGSGSTSGDG